jgi:hypothetical protein
MFRKHLLAALCAVGFLMPAVASAQYPWYGPIAGGYGGYDNGLVYPFFYRVRSIPTPPYFALQPPVYYGPRLLYRPYGNSPFAYPSWYERQFGNVPPAYHVAPVPGEPKLILNPFVKSKQGEGQQAAETPAEARVVANPFVAASR